MTDNSFNFQNPIDLDLSKQNKTIEPISIKKFYDINDFDNVVNNQYSQILKNAQSFQAKNTLQYSDTTSYHGDKFNKSGDFGAQLILQKHSQLNESLHHFDFLQRTASNAFAKVKPEANQIQMQKSDLLTQIKYYEDATELAHMEERRLLETTQEQEIRLYSPTLQNQINIHAQKTIKINSLIQNQRNLESQLNKILSQLQDQYQGVVKSIQAMEFSRPLIKTQETQLLIKQIDDLKIKCHVLNNMQDNSIRQSCSTLRQQHPNVNENEFLTTLHAIHEVNRESSDPQFLQNLKMSCLKDQSVLFTSNYIQISVNYKVSPKIKICIGNKMSTPLSQLKIIQDGITKYEGELSGRTYYIHEILVDNELLQKIFIPFEIVYTVQKQTLKHKLFVASGVSHFGCFAAVTENELKRRAQEGVSQHIGDFKPIDTTIIQDVDQCVVYFPNLINFGTSAKGLFVSADVGNQMSGGKQSNVSGTSTVISFKQRGDLCSVSAIGPNITVLKLLDFVFTV